MSKVRKKQCPNCPWKTTTTAIPGGSDPKWDELLRSFEVSGMQMGLNSELKMMQCHDTQDDEPKACTGWVAHEMGPGNNLGLRLRAIAGGFEEYETVGPQRTSLKGLTFDVLEEQK